MCTSSPSRRGAAAKVFLLLSVLAATGTNKHACAFLQCQVRTSRSAELQKRYTATGSLFAANDFREPAGAESLFSIRSRRRKSKWRKRFRDLLERNNKCNDDDLFCWDDNQDVQRTRKQLNVPSWACVDAGEEQRLAAMKYLLQDDLKEFVDSKRVALPGESSEREVLTAFPDVYSDFRLLRFLRKDRNQEPVSAALRYRNFLKWRNKYNVDKRIRVLVQEAPFEPPPRIKIVGDYIKTDFNVETTHEDETKGDTIPTLLLVGEWDTAGITRIMKQGDMTIDEFLQYWTYMYESLHFKLYQESMKRKKMMYIDEICDLTSSHLGQVSPGFLSLVIRPWITMTQANYAETAKHICFLNPPRILSIGWALVAPLINANTAEKIRLHPNFDGDSHDFVKKTSGEHRGRGAAL